MVYQFVAEQFIPISLEEAWSFFSTPGNLAEITPPSMGFVILGDPPEKMYAGQIIQYTVKPILNIPTRWVTEITHVREPYYFVDEQRHGPYKMWHHQHIFKEVDGGVMMKDIVTYEPPLLFLGQIAHSLFIKTKIKGIFQHRKTYLEQKYNLK